jgi:hypothetical protein
MLPSQVGSDVDEVQTGVVAVQTGPESGAMPQARPSAEQSVWTTYVGVALRQMVARCAGSQALQAGGTV